MQKELLIPIEDFSDYNDVRAIFLIPNITESKVTLGFLMTQLIKDQINHRDRITNRTQFFYISNEDIDTGLYNGEILDTVLYSLDGVYDVYRILADTNGNLYLQWARDINADAYVPPYQLDRSSDI
jgi:hypothetical protein